MRGRYEKPVDIPKYVLAVIDELAALQGRPTKRLVADWLWEKAHQQASNSNLPRDLVSKLRHLPEPYDPETSGLREYQRRVASGG